MTFAPRALLELRTYLMQHTGITDFRQLGIVGDENHLGNYHHGWDQRRPGSDYSWNESARDSSHRTNAARAIDIGSFPRLRELSIWLAGQCAAGAPDCADIREVIYSPDGRTVRRWDRLGIRSSGDSSHLTHTHVSYFADAEGRDKTGPFRRFFEGEEFMAVETDVTWMAWRMEGITNLRDKVIGGPGAGEDIAIVQAVKQVATDVAELKGRAPVHLSDADRLRIADLAAEAVLARLLPILDTSAIAARVVDQIRPVIDAAGAEARDAVGDGLEGGAAQVRADAG